MFGYVHTYICHIYNTYIYNILFGTYLSMSPYCELIRCEPDINFNLNLYIWLREGNVQERF